MGRGVSRKVPAEKFESKVHGKDVPAILIIYTYDIFVKKLSSKM